MTATIPTTLTTASDGVGELNLITRRERDRQVKRFVQKYDAAISRQIREGEVTAEEGAVLREALKSTKKIKNGRTYAEQLYFEVYLIAGDFFDDVQAFFRSAVQWLIENWETVLRVALTLLLMLI